MVNKSVEHRLDEQTNVCNAFMNILKDSDVSYISELFCKDEMDYTYRSLTSLNSGKSQFVDALCNGNVNAVVDLLKKYDYLNVDFEGGEPLTTAVYYGHVALAEFLLEQGADVNIRNGDSLIIACKAGNLDLVSLLIKYGADVHVRGESPLKIAYKAGYNDIVDALVGSGAVGGDEIDVIDDSIVFHEVTNIGFM